MSAAVPATGARREGLWGGSWRQRLRLMPLYLAMRAADALASRLRSRSRTLPSASWQEGVSIIIPERDAPAMLGVTLDAVDAAVARIDEPHETIVVVNGAPASRYDALRTQRPNVRFLFHEAPLAFARAVAAGLDAARYDWVLLLNNDMRVESECVAELTRHRAPDVFAIAAQIHQRSADGRREETGFTDWYVDGNGVHLFHASPPRSVTTHLCASGGAALFRTRELRTYVPASFAYDPFYWEDAEWSVRAWRDGWRVLFAPTATAEHAHRATTARFYAADELARIIERNRLLFDARHGPGDERPEMLMRRICDLPYTSQRELARPAAAVGVLMARMHARRAPQPTPPPRLWSGEEDAVALAQGSYSYRLQRHGRPRLLLVTPFAIFPPRHGGARRITELVRVLREDYDIVLVSDEAHLYDARSFAFFDGLSAVYLVQRREIDGDAAPKTMDRRMRAHAHRALVDTVRRALDEQAPSLVQIEHAELALLIEQRRPAERWVLGLHDACRASDFSSPAAFDTFERDVVTRFDAVTVCSAEDAALTTHERIACVPNGSAVSLDAARPSKGARMLFVGPFRYAPNAAGITQFLRDTYPRIRTRVPEVELVVLGGDEALRVTRDDPVFAQPGVRVLGHRDDVPRLLDEATLTINPLVGIRGSAVKLVESLCAGRVCVSTEEGARGFADEGFAGLVIAPDIASMATPIIELLLDEDGRHRREEPDPSRLAKFQWSACAAIQRELYASLTAAAANVP